MRVLSTAGLTSIFSQNSDEVWLALLTISHPSLDAPLMFVSNTESITSRGNIFVGYVFSLELPAEDPDMPGEARLVISNIDRAIVNLIRSLSSPPSILIEIVLASQPDTVEASFDGLVLREAGWDAMEVRGTLKYDDILTEPISVQMTPSRFPGLF